MRCLRSLDSPPFEFVGNVEGGGLTAGEADVVVTDGFTGNVAIKLMEGTTRTLIEAIRSAIRSGTISKVGGALIRGRLAELRDRLDPETVAGAYLLGLRGPVVVCHGSSTRHAIANADRACEPRRGGGRRGSHRRRDGGGRRETPAGRGDAQSAPASVPADTLGAR